jgi:hypothetical protein
MKSPVAEVLKHGCRDPSTEECLTTSDGGDDLVRSGSLSV